MEIIAHRGCHDRFAPNSLKALVTAIKKGYGIETDLRDRDGKIVISHDMPGTEAPLLEALAEDAGGNIRRVTLALNVKADGLKVAIRAFLLRHGIEDYFLFDMSIPQMVEYLEQGMNVYTRRSEYEITPVLYEQSGGIWLDGFSDTAWIDKALLAGYTRNEKPCCIVSPELHGNQYREFWESLKRWEAEACLTGMKLCTDFPDEADAFFNGRK